MLGPGRSMQLTAWQQTLPHHQKSCEITSAQAASIFSTIGIYRLHQTSVEEWHYTRPDPTLSATRQQNYQGTA